MGARGGGVGDVGSRGTNGMQPRQANGSVPQSGGFGGGGFGGGFGGGQANTALIQYLETNQGSTKFLVAVPSSMNADSIILATNKPVMALGGFSGSDPILTTSQLQTLIKNGTIRFFLLNAPRGNTRIGGTPPGQNQTGQNQPVQGQPAMNNFFGGGQNGVTGWVTQHCATVSASAWQSSSTTSSPVGGSQLYDCSKLK